MEVFNNSTISQAEAPIIKGSAKNTFFCLEVRELMHLLFHEDFLWTKVSSAEIYLLFKKTSYMRQKNTDQTTRNLLLCFKPGIGTTTVVIITGSGPQCHKTSAYVLRLTSPCFHKSKDPNEFLIPAQ